MGRQSASSMERPNDMQVDVKRSYCRALSILPAIAALVALMPGLAQAQTYYVRAGASGSNNGSDWTNAFSSWPRNLVRGATYYVAAGSYGSLYLDAAGTSTITFKNATNADHGTNTGWSSSYAGQAVFSTIHFVTGHYTLDGQTRNESNWQDVASYGFRSTGGLYSSAFNPGPACATNITVRYMDVGGQAIGNSFSASNPETGVYMGGFGSVCSNWTISRSHIHNVVMVLQGAGVDGALIEYTHMGPAWQKEAIRGQLRMSNTVIRYNVFKDSCQFTPGDSTSGCTAEIAAWGETGSGRWDGNQIYGNVFQKTTNEHNSGGVIVVGGNGSSWVGSPANNTKIYNNTIVGFKQGNAGILVNGGSGNEVRNNIWSDLGNGVAHGATANTTSNNVVVPTSTFVSYPSNLRLATATSGGTTLPSAYATDIDGVTRGTDGVWDLGAFEFGGVAIPKPSPPMGLQVQ